MDKLDLSTLPKNLRPNPIFKGMPDSLKDPKVFKEVEEKLRQASISDHKHSSVKAFVKCSRCKDKLARRQTIIKEYGFKDIRQYLEWRRIQTIIRDKRNFKLR